MSVYDDLYVRDALDDDGIVPYMGATMYLSPDIIPAQNRVLSATQLIGGYRHDPLDTNIVEGQYNNIYVRARNLSSQCGSGTVSLYYAASSLLLKPEEWINNIIPSAGDETAQQLVDAAGSFSIEPNDIAVASSAFTFLPPRVPTGFHYCLVAQIVTDTHPNPIPQSFPNTAQFVDWVVNTPAIAWRNVNVVPAGLKVYSQEQNFSNVDSNAANYMFIVQGTGWPDNTEVNIQCTAVTFNFSYTGWFGPPSEQQNVMTIQLVPAYFTGSVLISINPHGLHSGTKAHFIFARFTDPTDDVLLRRYSLPAAFFGVRGSYAQAEIVRLGECFMVVGS